MHKRIVIAAAGFMLVAAGGVELIVNVAGAGTDEEGNTYQVALAATVESDWMHARGHFVLDGNNVRMNCDVVGVESPPSDIDVTLTLGECMVSQDSDSDLPPPPPKIPARVRVQDFKSDALSDISGVDDVGPLDDDIFLQFPHWRVWMCVPPCFQGR